VLARPLERITVAEALAVLGGRLYDPEFCDQHGGAHPSCTHTIDCSIRSLWHRVQYVVDQVLGRTTLAELLPKTDAPPLPQVAPAQLTRLSL
jgi:DNA-binding IscR family transcriptional regulator